MFFLTRERQEIFNAANAYPFGEEFEADFEEYLYEHLTEYIELLPAEFRSEVLGRTLFQNGKLMLEFEAWCRETIEQFNEKSAAVHEKREAIVERFDPSAQTVFSQTFHDGKILFAEQQGDHFKLLLDMSGGFTVESIIELVFQDAKTDGILEGYYIYDELVETEDGFALRVLSSFGSPYVEWTIFFKNVTANYLYRPAVYVEPGEVVTWEEYVAALDPEDKYFIVENMSFKEIELSSLQKRDNGIFVGDVLLGSTFEEARERIYCDTYENPYAHFSEPIPIEELFTAMFDIDQTIRVRAFNTIFELGEEVADIVNEGLRKADVNAEDPMYFSILASHFEKLGCLEDDVRTKWLND